MSILKQKIEAIKALEDKISEGPWEALKNDYDDGICDGLNNWIVSATCSFEQTGFNTIDNRDFCVLSRNTIFELIDAVKEAEKFVLLVENKYGQRAGNYAAKERSEASLWLSKYNGGE